VWQTTTQVARLPPSLGILRERPGLVAALFVFGWGACLFGALAYGTARPFAPAEVVRGLFAALGAGEPLAGADQTIWRLRALRALAALSVGGALGLSGALLQGLFRNPLASPGVLGVTSGSSLGASLALALLGGFASGLGLEGSVAPTPLFVTAGALAGALLVLVPLLFVAGGGGRVSVPALLLAGMAMNALCSGLLAALQSLTLSDLEVARALFAWAFGTLDDRSAGQVTLVWVVLLATLAAAPFVTRELDLLAGGEEDAAALGVSVPRVRLAVLLLAALLAAAAVSVAGQILFVGLIVPHVVRLTTGAAHRSLLPLSALGGGLLVLGADGLQRACLPDVDLRPGVLMSLLGAPFFLSLLARSRAEVRAW
jgi:iron complex transport system permease protein